MSLLNAPTNVLAAFHTEVTARISWDEVEKATGYRLYRNGRMIADQLETEFIDTSVPYDAVLYHVTAYNKDGESNLSLGVSYAYFPEDTILRLITDRTYADLAQLKSLLEKALSGTASDSEWKQLNEPNNRGAYNNTDLNRVTFAMEYLDGVLSARGYETGYRRINLPRPGSYRNVALFPDSVEKGEEYDTYTFTAPGSGAFFCEADYGTGVNSATVEVDVGGEYSIDLSDTTQWLYHEGDECESITGGWDSPSIKTTGYYWDSQSAYTDAPVCTKNSDNLYVKIVHRAGYYGISAASFWVKNAIDLTNVSTLYFDINLLVGHCRFMVSDKNPFTTQFDCNKTSPKYPTYSVLGENVVSVDVSDLSGAYYIGFGTELYADFAYTAEVKLKSVWFE